jgi:small-conductance mechanosensitive channel
MTGAAWISWIALAWSPVLANQAQSPPAQAQAPGSAATALGFERSGTSVEFVYANRPIVTLRGRVLGREPAERARGATRILDDLIDDHISGPVESRAIDGGYLITVASRVILGVSSADIDELAGETVDGVAAQTVSRLQQAIGEAFEARAPARLAAAAGLAIAGLALGLLTLWGIARAHRWLVDRLAQVSERTITRSGFADASSLRAMRLLEIQRGVVTAVTVALGLVVAYGTLTFVLRRFPYTRPWGESMRGFLLMTVERLGGGAIDALPGLFTVALIVVITRFLTRLVGLWFKAVEEGRARARWIYPETAQPTRRLVTTLLWLFAVVVAYPYMPGSQTEAFKGVSVFLGLMVTFGSTGLVNQIMSGLMLTYSRALRVGDYVRIGEIEGSVIHLGMLSTKIKSYRGEEQTIPNAVVVAQTTTDFSRFAETGPVFMPTTVTIGYDTPWRQVQALLLLAAERTAGVKREPKPYVIQESLQDFYVKYTLCVCVEIQERRVFTLHDLHAQIQDLFNEYGVQIMSPNYVFDPGTPKMVAKKDWYAAPAGLGNGSAGDEQQPRRPDDEIHAAQTHRGR